MSLQKNKETVRRFVERVQNQHDLDALDELFSPDFIDHSGMTDPPTREGTRTFFNRIFSAFPDMHFTIHLQIAEGDQVVTHKTFHGAHLGNFMNIPATGKQVEFDVIDICTVIDGKITAHQAVSDHLRLLQQLGAVPAPA